MTQDLHDAVTDSVGWSERPLPRYMLRAVLFLGVYGIDARFVATLNRVLRETRAELCVSSTLRLHQSLAQMQGHLAAKGFEGLLLSATPHMPERSRGLEIQAWLSAHPTDRYAIVEDAGQHNLEHLADHVVPLDGDGGLDEQAAAALIALLRA